MRNSLCPNGYREVAVDEKKIVEAGIHQIDSKIEPLYSNVFGVYASGCYNSIFKKKHTHSARVGWEPVYDEPDKITTYHIIRDFIVYLYTLIYNSININTSLYRVLPSTDFPSTNILLRLLCHNTLRRYTISTGISVCIYGNKFIICKSANIKLVLKIN